MDSPALCFILTMLVLVIVPTVVPAPCPRSCSCPQPTELHCTFRTLLTIPPAVSKRTERMNLGFNSINKITERSLAGLSKLEMLMIHGNDIQAIPDGAFRDLSSLQMLKMSYNKLKEISRHTLQGLWSIARLHLDHNHLEFIHPDAFQGLISLRLLQLEGNRLQQLHPATFSTFTVMDHFYVSTLRHLYLSDNVMTSLPSRLVASMPQLENLYLHGNPWTCDCNMKWFHDWYKAFKGVLKCKKDRALPGGELCPMCSSPKHLQKKELQHTDNFVCSSPVISSPHRTSPPEGAESEVLTSEAFLGAFGNISMGLSDEHGNKVDLECSFGEPRELNGINWEQVDRHNLSFNITFAVDVECPVDREKYERLWRLIAYYSSVPAHLQRGPMLKKEPHPTYVYRQDSEKDAQYYTGVKVNMMTQPAWLMQASADLQLNRLKSSAKVVKLILSMDFAESVEAELVQRQRREWVMIESMNTTRKGMSAILGRPSQMVCNVHSSSQAVIQWMLPDGSKVEAPFSSSDNRVSVSSEGQLVIRAVSHSDAGIYYCIAKVHGDLASLAFHLTVQESSSSPPREDTRVTSIDRFAGSPITLPCNASGSPDAEINWILPSSNIVHFQANSSRAFVSSNGSLYIPQSQLLDNGYYKCIAINQHGVDTVATKVSIIRKKGLIKPLRNFPAQPQSASGVNTKIKVPTEALEEASGDTEGPQAESQKTPSDSLRRRIPGGAVPSRGVVHPSRNVRRRPLVPRKPAGPGVDNRRNVIESRRKINVSKSKIDPEKWADILAKIRDRKAQNAVTSGPERKLPKQTTHLEETFEGSSDGVQETGEENGVSVKQTQKESIIDPTQSQGPHETSKSLTAHTSDDKTPTSGHRGFVTPEPHVTQTSYNVQHTTMTLDPHTTSNSVFFLPQTTAVPLHAVTFWQRTTNIASRSHTSSLEDNQNTNTDVVKVTTADWSKRYEENNEISRSDDNASSNYDGEHSPSKSGTIPTANRNDLAPSQEETGTTSESLISTKDTRRTDLKSQEILTMAPTTTRRRGSKGKSSRHQSNSRKRNGGRRRRPNGRKQHLNKLVPSIPIPTSSALLDTTDTIAFTHLKIDPSGENFNKTAPSQAATSRPLSHKESTASRHEYELSSPSPTTETKSSPLSKPLFKITSAAPAFPTAFPGVGHGSTSSQTALGISETPKQLTSTPQQTSMIIPHQPVSSSEEIQKVGVVEDLGPVPTSESPSGAFYPVTQAQTDVWSNKSSHHTEMNEELLFKESGNQSESVSDPSFIEHVAIKTTRYPSDSFDPDAVTTIVVTESSFYSSSQNRDTNGDVLIDKLSEDTENTGTNVDGPMLAPPTDTPSRSDQTQAYISYPEAKTTGRTQDSNPTQEAPRINNFQDHTSQSQQIQPITTSEPQTTQNLPPEISPTDHIQDVEVSVGPTSPFQKSTSKQTLKETASPAPTQNLPSEINPTDHTLVPDVTVKPTSPSLKSTSKQTIKQTASPAPTQNLPSEINPTDHTLVLDVTVKPTSYFLKSTSKQIIKQTASPAPTTAGAFSESHLASTQDMSGKFQLPGGGLIPRGKPRITKSDLKTFTVKAETDAQLHCEAEGEPMPFLSWTKVASGASIAQNTRVQRFEVRQNGSLIIRNTQPVDSGQYLCMVQNQYGTDNMVVNLVVLTHHPRVLQPRHRDVSVNLGSTVDLECKVEGHPTPRVTWVLPNQVHMPAAPLGLIPQQRVAVLSNGSLQISQVTFTDRGIYKCIGSSVAGADTVSVRLYVSALPPVIQQTQQENTTLPEGSTAFIHCTATGSPLPVIHWITPDGVQLTVSQFLTRRNLFVFPNGTLSIKELGPGNAGRYICSANNMVASSRRTVFLNIKRTRSLAKAMITTASTKIADVMYGDRLILNCVATGEPEPRIMWRTPNKKLVDSQFSFDPRIKVYPNGSITVHHVTDEDGGDYLCVARNKMGDDYVQLQVNVQTKPAKIRQKLHQSNQEVVYGGDLKVDCVASGLPNPEISWALPDGTMVNPAKRSDRVSGGRSRRYVVFDNGTLFFNDVGMPEEGDYTCYAENQLGKDEMKVRVKVKVPSTKAKIQDKSQKTVKVFYGETVTLRCSAKGEPVPSIMWISPTHKVITPALDKYQILDDGTLVIQRVQRYDGGNYTCIARNNAGQDHKVTKLEVLVTSPVINNLRGETNTIKVAAIQNQRKLIDCAAKGKPDPRIMWVLPGNVVLPAPYSSNRMTVHPNGSLEIHSVKKTDSGQLACIARNEGGEVKLMVNLEAKGLVERPQITGPSSDSLSLTVGNAMILNCSFDGLALTQVTWFLPNGASLQIGARFLKFFHHPSGSLIVSNPSVAEAGTYRCVGRNSRGLAERIITLLPGRRPEINNRYNSPVSVSNGQPLLLHCTTSGEPLRLTWTLPSGVVLNRPQRAGRYAVLPNGTLAIQQISVYDRGAYVCRAANEFGSSVLSASVIVIAYPPQITNGPPPVTYAKRGVAVQLNCAATGIPKVDVAWETPDKTRLTVSAQPRLFGNKYLHPQGSLIIQNPTQRDAGMYRCIARNAIGTDSKTTFLNVF